VLAVVVLFLVAAYRSLGGSPPRAADSSALLRSAAATLRSAVDNISAALVAAAQPEQPEAQPQPDSTRDGRRASAAVQQLLDRLPSADQLDATDQAARVLLTAAAEDASWAWRMIAAGISSPGMAAAVGALHDHASACAEEADGLLAAPGGEPGDRP
jgi:hypothetical protein